MALRDGLSSTWSSGLVCDTHTHTQQPTSPFTQHTTWQYKCGQGLVARPPIRARPGIRITLSSNQKPSSDAGAGVSSGRRLLSLVHTGLLLLALCRGWLNALAHTHTRKLFMTALRRLSERCRLKRSSAEVAGSWSSAGLAEDIYRLVEIQTITEETRKWLEVTFCLWQGVFLLLLHQYLYE